MGLPSFFWNYGRRYLGWGLLCLFALALFAVTSGAMVALLPAVYDEVLLVEAEDAPGLSLGAADDGGSAAFDRTRQRLEGMQDRVQDWFRERYEDLQELLGVAEDRALLNPVHFAPVLFVLVFLLRSLSSFVSDYTFQRIGFGITTDLRNDLYDRILHQSIRFHSRHPSGELFSRVVNDVTRIQSAASDRLLDLPKQTVTLLICIVALFLLHARLAAVCLIATPLIIVPIVRFGRGIFKTSHRSQERMADLSELLTEGIRGNRVVKAFGMEEFESRRFRTATARHLQINLKARVLAASSSPVIESLAAVGACTLLIFAGRMIRQGALSPSQFLTFLTVLFLLYDPVRKLNKVNLILQDARAAAQRVRDIMLEPNEIEDAPSAEPIERVRGDIRFEGVDFAYGEKEVLSGFDLEVEAGQVVALVGPSGAGKSTLVNLLPRFFDPDGGAVRIDGVDIRTLPLANLRSAIGIVTQETILFNDSVRNNIAYGRSDLPLERVREAAAAAYADDFIMELENGYDTVIGEAGLQLSGGQRQRLAIARALLKNAPILILDEATSHLDTESEVLVQRAIYNLMEGRTALVIAHRLSTVTRADRILVLDRGRIVEEGDHPTLLARGGAYKRLYDLQFREHSPHGQSGPTES